MFFVHLIGINNKRQVILWYGDVDQASEELGVRFRPTKGGKYTVECDVTHDGDEYVANGFDMRIGKPVYISG